MIDYVRQLRTATATLGDAALVRMLPDGPDEHPEYLWWWRIWCPRHAQLNNGAQLMDRVRSYCSAHGGAFREPVCASPLDPGKVIFFARLDRGSATCSNVATPVGVQLAEPKPGAERSAAFVEVLHKGGWLAPDEQRAAERAQTEQDLATARAAILAERMERERSARELPLLRTRGTRICREEGQWTFVAFVEDSTDRKIQYRVADVVLTRSPTASVHPGGFAPGQIEWDFPERWRVCELH